MGWFGSSPPTKVSTVTEVREESSPQQFLEDLPPKFEDKEPPTISQPTYADAFKEFKLSDFSAERFIGMPCFREAMLTGFQAMGVLGTVTFLIHKNPNRSLNWAFCGFFLGNVVGWEQCRSVRRKSFQTVEKAKQANLEKNARIWEQKQKDDDSLKKWDEVQHFEEKK